MKGRLLTKSKKSPYDIACDAIHLKMEEDSCQQVLGNVSKLHNIQQEYVTRLQKLEQVINPDKYRLHVFNNLWMRSKKY